MRGIGRLYARFFTTILEEDKKKLNAFAVRSGLKLKQETLLDATTHISFPQKSIATERYHYLGENLLRSYVSEYIMFKYKQIPVNVVQTCVSAFCGPEALAKVGSQLGVQFVMRCKSKDINGPASARAYIVNSLVGATFMEKGPVETKKWIKDYILSRQVDIDRHIDLFVKTNKPRQLLSVILKKAETGRASASPVFIVGMYSGFEKLGEGHGSSLQMAETRAVKNALTKHYGAETLNTVVPSDFEPEESISFFQKEKEK